MARINEQLAGGRNVLAFLDAIAWAEGTSTSQATKDNGYDVIVTGIGGIQEIFTDYADHPFAGGRKSKVINSRGLTSNASGRYQQMLKDWPHYKALLKLENFGPQAQDRLAIQHLKEQGALQLIKDGKIAKAVEKVKNIWASLPGAGYGQQERKLDDFIRVYRQAGGVVSP